MAKGKANPRAVTNRPAYSRVSFLYQAAALLAIGSESRPAEQGLAGTTDPSLVVSTGSTGAEGPVGPVVESASERAVERDPAELEDPEPVQPTQSEEHAQPAVALAARTASMEAAVLPSTLQAMSRHLLTHMRSVARKTNMRLRPAVKRSVCKFCDTLLVEGDTCVSTVENRSRGGAKPWADVLVMRCRTCGQARRYPVAAPRQLRRPFRSPTMGLRPKSQTQAQTQTQTQTQTKTQTPQQMPKPQPQPQQNQESLHVSKAAG